MYLVAPESVGRHLAQLTELSATTLAATDRGQPRLAATIDAGKSNTGVAEIQPPGNGDTSRLAAATDNDARFVARLEGEVEFLRGQISTKDAQIKELTERSRETNVLIAGLQKMLLAAGNSPPPPQDRG